MTTDKLNTEPLFIQLDKATDNFMTVVSSTKENLIDEVPFESSWTVAQLASHVTKSIKGIAQALEMPGKPLERKADERVEELKKMFLDYNVKYQSPEFVLPTQTKYHKKEIITKLQASIDALKKIRSETDLSEVINLPAFGEMTKFELLYFVVFHTTRHSHQLKNIIHIINNKNKIMTQVNAYISFNGKCREAMNFYKDCLGGELMMQTIGESPIKDQCPLGTENDILHASLSKNGMALLMGSDMTSPEGYTKGNNIALSLNCSSEDEINNFFSKLSDGGKITDPLKPQFWGAIFGVLVDKFDLTWMLNYQQKQ